MFPLASAFDITMKEGMQPGYYAQIIKKLADTEALLDRDRNLLFAKPELAERAAAVLQHYGVAYEESEWLSLGLAEAGWATTRLWSDYGITTRSGALFLERSLGMLVAIEPAQPDAEPDRAGEQLDEHALAVYRPPGGLHPVYAIDRQQLMLAEGIARAYGCAAIPRTD